MKNLYILLLAILISITAFGQAPEGMSYQAVIKDAQNRVLISKKISIKISIIQDSNDGSAVYSETQSLKTNSNGLVSLTIGAGNSQDNFGDIDWAYGSYYIKTEIDPKGGNNYAIKGTSQLLSVPYALHAKTAEGLVGNAKAPKPRDGSTEIDPFFTVSPAGGISDFDITNWNTDDVNSVAGKQGAVVLVSSDITDLSTSNVPEGSKLYYTEDRVSINSDVAANSLKTGITTAQAGEITTNTLKTGITSQQASDITTNNAKLGYTEALVSANTDVAANTTHSGLTTNPHAVTKTQIGLSNVENIKVNLQAFIPPASDNDTNEGYSVGSRWIDINGDKEYVCLDATIGLAVWTATSSSSGSASQDLAAVVALGNTADGQLKNVSDPTEAQDAATKAYVDALEAKLTAMETRITDLEGGGGPAAVGDFRAGGVVFWVDPTDNTHGLVCAIQDQSTGIQWYNGEFTTIGATGTAIGTGASNTDAIINNQGATETSYAAGIAKVYGGGGYTDWFLPSKDELNEMYLNRAAINTTATVNGGVDFSTYYWSSTENYLTPAWGQDFRNGDQFPNSKSTTYYVRAVRAF